VDRGDIIAFRYPEHPEQTFVKRLIGMPGDRIRLVDKQVIRNGRRLVESYARHTGPTRDPYRDDFPSVPPSRASMRRVRAQEMFDHHVVNGELIVPAGALFVMGDNRDNSLDSRYWGFVPSENVVGRPLFVYWSYAAEEEDGSQRGNFAQHFLSRTRWERTLFVPRSQ